MKSQNQNQNLWSSKDEQELKRLINKRKKFKTEKTHDIHFVSSLLDGEEGEQIVVDALLLGEIKRDYGVGNTGNLFIEHKCSNRDSGITTSKADYWVFVFDGEEFGGEVFVGIKTDRLRKLLSKIKWEVNGGDNNASKGKLLRANTLLRKNSAIDRKKNERVGKSKDDSEIPF